MLHTFSSTHGIHYHCDDVTLYRAYEKSNYCQIYKQIILTCLQIICDIYNSNYGLIWNTSQNSDVVTKEGSAVSLSLKKHKLPQNLLTSTTQSIQIIVSIPLYSHFVQKATEIGYLIISCGGAKIIYN